MNYIRTTDADGNPISREQEALAEEMTAPAAEAIGLLSSEENGIRKKEGPEPLTQAQVDALNALMEEMDRRGSNTVDTLVGMRDTFKQQGVNPEMQKKILTDFVKAEYLDPNRDWNAKQAANALHILLGTDKKEAAAMVHSWWTHPNE